MRIIHTANRRHKSEPPPPSSQKNKDHKVLKNNILWTESLKFVWAIFHDVL